MAVLVFLIEIYAATMLLLFAVRFVRTGIERRFGASFQSMLTAHNNRVYAATAGMGLAVAIQSSAAVALLLTGFAAAGLVPFGLALAGVLGADLGSALVIQILTFDLRWLLPILLALGGWLYLKSERRNLRLTGRIILGIAFILISLEFLREAVTPLRESDFLPAVALFLERDFVTAFLAGAVLAFVMHSSVAVILMCVTLVQVGALPFAAGVSLVLGANLGSAFIPLWMTRDLPATARRIPLANLMLRGAAAIAVLLVLGLSGATFDLRGMDPGQALVLGHIGFNFALVLLALPVVQSIHRPMAAILTEQEVRPSAAEMFAQPLTATQNPADFEASVAITTVRQDLLNMVTQVERMYRPVLDVYEQDNPDAIAALWDEDERVNTQLTDIRRFVARLPRQNMSKPQTKEARGLFEYAIRLEAAGDIVSKRMTRLARDRHEEGVSFSTTGWAEIVRLHATVLESFALARHVLLVDDLECARRLVLEKAEVKRMERQSRKAHLKRLERGTSESFRSSDLHLETLRALRDLHGHVVSVAYPILYRNGQVLETRLITEIDDDAMTD